MLEQLFDEVYKPAVVSGQAALRVNRYYAVIYCMHVNLEQPIFVERRTQSFQQGEVHDVWATSLFAVHKSSHSCVMIRSI